MKKRGTIPGGIALLVLFGALFLWSPSSPPPGQQPVITLSTANFAEFEKAFDAGIDVPRLVLLLSPT